MERGKRAAAGALALVMTAALAVVLATGSGKAAETTSLPHIEAIVNSLKGSSSSFNILEIVPQADTGSIGYYVSGQEPTADWKEKAGELKQGTPDENGTYASAAVNRGNYVSALLSSLQSAQLLGSGTDTPLTAAGAYSETLPWDRNSSMAYKTLSLDHSEAVSVTGVFTKKESGSASSGFDYTQQSRFEIVENGAYVQNISHFLPAPDASGGACLYYAPQFAELTETGAQSLPDKNIAVYTNAATDADAEAAPDYASYRYYGQLVNGLEYGKVYYYVTDTGTPSTVMDGAHPYKALLNPTDPYHAVSEGGHFNLTVTGYTYVGDGQGIYQFTKTDSGAADAVTIPITYQTVYYIGGYTNNNWFLTDVLNAYGDEISQVHVRVTSVTPGSLTDSMLSSIQGGGYGLVVLSAGYSPSGAAVASYGSGNDLASTAKAALSAAAANKTPFIVDNALTGAGLQSTNIGSLSSALKGRTEDSFISNNVYFVATRLATKDFNTRFTPDTLFTDSDAPFYDAYYELCHENFLRKTENPDIGTDGLLEEWVSMAKALRYVINYAQQRPITKKTSIRVLELEPGRGSDSTTTALKSKIRTWTGLPTVDADGKDPITIDRLSTAEFIGKIDDLIEKYDMIYVGSDLTGFNVAGGMTQYNDQDMNGLIYSNIGDEWITDKNYKLSGLLDRDYSTQLDSSTGYYKIDTSNDTARTFRMSGNDITETKVRELENFAAAGHPVVISGDLMRSVPALPSDFTFSAQVVNSSGTLTASYSPSTLPDGLTASYQWKKDSSIISGATGSTYTPSVSDGAYTCEITIGGVTAVSNTATATVVQHYQADAANPSKAVAGDWSSYSSGGTLYTISVTHTDSYNYGIAISPDIDTDTISYQWYGSNSQNKNWNTLSGETSSQFNDSYPYSYYRCGITINGFTFYTASMLWNATSQTATTFTRRLFNVGVTSSAGVSAASLSANCVPAVSSYVLYRWINASSGTILQSATLSATSGTYYCSAYIYSSASAYNTNLNKNTPSSYAAYARSNNYTVTSDTTLSIAVSGSGSSVTVPAHGAYLSASPATVDNSSKIDEFLSYAASRKNTFLGDSTLDSNALIQYLNLSAPKINLSETPTEYTGPSSSNAGGRALTYRFTISNETDVTPVTTRYICNFYIDMNADGKYDDTEQIADIRITDSGGTVVSSDELQAGISYTVTRQLPTTYVGILPWKLEVVKVGDESVHASQHGYTRILPEESQKTKIKILQILNGNSVGTSLNLTSNSTYRNIFPQATDFDLTISTITMSSFNGGPFAVTTRDVSTASSSSSTQTFSSRTELLDSYDMLILGFADCYGNLGGDAASAVVSFIGSGKSVLFTHDTTSICNLPQNYYPTTSGSTVDQGSYYWGYYFNTLVRDAVKLDRYGVTNPDYGVTNNSPNKSALTDSVPDINLAADGSGLSAANISALDGAGYSIAYQPGSAKGVTLDDVQGVAAIALLGQTNSTTSQFLPSSDSNCYFQTDGGNYITQSVSQVNQGQITTYPFNLNMKGFTKETNTSLAPLCNQTVMQIAKTHNQYYQLNMNSDDIAVWYCLADASDRTSDNVYGCTPNDVMNNYYIYSVGNVTYSGAGHSGDSVSTYEAELFVNTMIAAYRPARTKPAVEVVDSPAGTNQILNYYLTADYGTGLNTGYATSLVESSDKCPVYFIVSDTNLESDRKIRIAVTDGEGRTYTYDGSDTSLTVRRAPFSGKSYLTNVNNTSNMISGMVYYFNLPQDVLNAFGSDGNASSMPITIKISTTFQNANGLPTTLEGDPYTLTLRKVGLLNLG